MRIVFITAGMGGGGSERVIANISNYLVQHHHNVQIIMTAESEIAYSLDKRIKTCCIGERTGGSVRKRITRIHRLRAIIASDKTQVVISFGTETNLYAILACLFLKNKLIISERNDPNQCSYKKIRNFLYRFADNFVFQTTEAQTCFSKRIEDKSIVIPNPIRENLPDPFKGERSKKIVAVGRLNYQKNHRLLLDAFYDFSLYHQEYQLVIYGQGELLTELKAYAELLHISNRVLFAGFSNTILQDIIDASMYVLSSDFEGISNSLMEAMAIGLPVISTDCPIGGSAELIETMHNGILVPIKDRIALGDAMKLLVENTQLTEKISKNAVNIKERYSNQEICKRWMEYIYD